jgi:hypothetical protein
VTHDPKNDDAVLKELQELRYRLAQVERRPRTRPWMIAGAVAGVMVAFNALGSMVCPNGIPYCFNANEPALASEVNADFAALKTWLEAKVGATGALASPSPDITTRNINAGVITANMDDALAYSPPYSTWGTYATGAGGATIVNDNATANYKALVIQGNNSAGGTHKIKMLDDVDVNGVVTANGYDVTCAGGRSGYHYAFCCRMDIRTGYAQCKNGTNQNWAGWDGNTVTSPFAASTPGRYSIDCTGTIDNVNWPICCRGAADGTVQCVASVNGGPLTWNTSVPNLAFP